MRCAIKIIALLATFCALLCLYPHIVLGLTTSNEEKISRDLLSAGFKVSEIKQKTIPMSKQTYFIAKASKDGDEFKIKIFDGKYFLSGEHGKLEPINIPGSRLKSLSQKSKKDERKGKKIDTAHFAKPTFSKNLKAKDSPKTEDTEKFETKDATNDADDFLNKIQPSIKLASASDVDTAGKSFSNGCYPVVFSRIADFGLSMQDTAEVINHAMSKQNIRLGGKIADPSKDFKNTKEGSSTEKIFKSAEKKNGKDPVTDSQQELAKRVNSKEMYKYTMQLLKKILSKEHPNNLTPDQMLATYNLDRLAKSLLKQGKSEREVYAILGRQLKDQFSGKIILNGTNPDSPWTLSPNGQLSIYTLANNKDQVLAYTAQALTLKNDRIYQSKTAEWIKTNSELKTLKSDSTSENNQAKIKNLENQIDDISKELMLREKEIFS